MTLTINQHEQTEQKGWFIELRFWCRGWRHIGWTTKRVNYTGYSQRTHYSVVFNIPLPFHRSFWFRIKKIEEKHILSVFVRRSHGWLVVIVILHAIDNEWVRMNLYHYEVNLTPLHIGRVTDLYLNKNIFQIVRLVEVVGKIGFLDVSVVCY